ncbi:biliverdin-producing heme oxygenase [Pseudomonas sp. NPDC090202]|uniref:biliverdin-producing heme oxygenase n=1 Tax=unclassified Pseudomonas TaxID=196821 RepID=UPI00381747D2
MPDANAVPSPVAPSERRAELLEQLRAATAPQHRRLEARLPFLRNDLDLATYRRIIQAYYGFHLPLQRELERFAVADSERQKIPALLKDLHALGLDAGQIGALPLCRQLPSTVTEAQRLGVMYVMEGATLGGQVLRRLVQDKLGIAADSGGEFLDVYGRDTARLWKAFLARLSDFDDHDQHGETVEAACATFGCFEDWLDRAGVLR